jgi:cation:H+ antiporter
MFLVLPSRCCRDLVAVGTRGGWQPWAILAVVALALLAIVAGLVLLVKAADHFVTGAARLSAALRVSPIIIGAVVVGFGTSAPEMVVSAIASWQGKLDIAAGNIIGSNVANLSLVLGVAALLCVMTVDSSALRREAPLSTAAVVLFAIVIQGGLRRWESAVLLVALIGALVFLFTGPRGGSDELVSEVDEFLDDDAGISLRIEGLRTALGLAGVIAGAQFTVEGASTVADRLGLGEGFIGLTLVALGTSLPELVTAIDAARKREDELIIGNLLGSNLFNSLAVGSVAGLVGPGPLDDGTLAGLGTAVMVLVAVGAWLFMFTGRRVARTESAALLAGYLVAIPLLA